ncbi:MAG: Nucleotide sugar dehydrogenase [Candidatus Roizmanbacteria bacterium GW2011_GWA2_36_23]|uniref:UDP-glucose 6-dehydrogenase n=1 Tax=Candidatus Roizmanbacteria bacterium GW2011_GWA2_36_23 TaxID=1618480 RepID=A0A0G0GQQ4_9BACT|nr:MAG: Nucleotide sugar dehydrogenase [Candidatus Roizmanbacteria bacterium GW2011_GWA2_36_23]
MTITFIGHGYVGLVTACVFSDFGNDIWVVGHTKEKIERLKKGDPIIYEPGLKELLEKNLKAKRLHFTLDYKEAISRSEIIFIAVGTPPKENGEANLSAVLDVSRSIAKHLKNKFTVVSCKSTVPVGTNKKVEAILNKHKQSHAEVAVASCPEFLREGTAIYDTLNTDRVVIGSDSKKAIDLLLELHKPINGKRVITDLASAELIKYTSNAMLATKISFANLISFFCEKTGADVERVLDAVGIDKRIGRIFMDPGVGYGGSCLPKDVKALISIGNSLGINTNYLEAVEKVNETARENMLAKIIKNLPGQNIAIWGLSFKPNTDDIRFAPSLYVIDSLIKKNLNLSVYDPAASSNIKKIYGNKIKYALNPYDAIENASALIVLTEWNEFKQIDLQKVKKSMKNPYIFDGRNIYSPGLMKKLGFRYFSVGRKSN